MGRKKKEYVECVLFTLPAIVLVMITIYIPFVMSGYYSLMEWNGISKKPVFIGLKNFTQMFAGSSDFDRSLVFTGKYTVLFMLFTNVLAIAAAVALV